MTLTMKVVGTGWIAKPADVVVTIEISTEICRPDWRA